MPLFIQWILFLISLTQLGSGSSSASAGIPTGS